MNKVRKLMRIIALLIVISTISQVAFADTDLFAVSYTTYDTTYDAIIKMYIKVLNAYGTGKTGRHDLFNELIISDFNSDYESPMKNRIAEAKNRIGYCISDLNKDGIDELIIGKDSTYVHEVFTTDNGKVRELIRAGYKYDCELLQDGQFFRVINNGAALHSYTLWSMNGTGKVSFTEGYIRNEENYSPCFFQMENAKTINGTQETQVNDSIFYSWQKNINQKRLKLQFIPLALYEKGLQADYNLLGIVSVNGRTTGNSTVRIRTKADPKSKVLKNCKVGTYVTILGDEGEYYKIQIDNKEGFILKDYLTRLSN